MAVDLHLHSTESDGILEPGELVRQAVETGLRAMAITDHDSVEGIPPALEAAEGLNIEMIPGVELSSDLDGRDIHFLGYFIDHQNQEFRAHLRELRRARYQRAVKMVEKLREAGLNIFLPDVLDEAGRGVLGRTHVARVMWKRGLVDNIEEAFRRYIGRQAPYYVEKYAFTPEDVISLIKKVGGVAVLAHPILSRVDWMIGEFVACGLDGLEIYHGEQSAKQSERYRKIAVAQGLIVTGGSDFHGDGIGGLEVGVTSAPDEVIDDLKRLRNVVGSRVEYES